MEAIFRKAGNAIDYTPDADVSSGDVVVVGDVPYVAERDIASGDLGALTCEGIFDILKDTSIITLGDAIYWHTTGTPVGGAATGAANNVATSGYLMGQAIAAAATDDTTVKVKLVPQSSLPRAGYPAAILGDLLADGVSQSLEELSDTQNYALGTRRIEADGRVFRYASVGTGGWTPGYGAFLTGGVVIGENIHATTEVGDTTIIIEEASIAANEWAGGLIVMGHGAGATTQNRRIVSNTASAATTNHVTVTLDYPLTAVLTADSDYVEIIKNEYTALSVSSNEYSSVMGVPVAVGTVGQYGWVQTWGPLWIVPGGAGTPGSTAAERTVYFVGDGSINGDVGLVDPTTEPERRQVAGFIIQRDSIGAGGPPFVMLQIAP